MRVEAPLQNLKITEGKVQSFVLELARAFAMNEQRFSECINSSAPEAAMILSGRKKISTAQFLKLSHVFSFSVEAAALGRVDINVLKDHYFGKIESLSNRYSLGSYSKKLNAINLLDTIGDLKGPYFKSYVLEYFQAGRNIYSDPNGYINVNFFCDVFSLLKRNGVTQQDISYIGERSVALASRAGFLSGLRVAKTPEQLFQVYFEQFIRDLEKNNLYKIMKMTPDFCLVESLENSEVCDLFGVKHIGTRERCEYRVGALKATTQFAGFDQCHVHETKCVFLGDASCRFYINYSDISRDQLKGSYELLC